MKNWVKVFLVCALAGAVTLLYCYVVTAIEHWAIGVKNY